MHDVNSVTSYPVEPMYDTEQVGGAIRKAVADRKAFDEGTRKGRFGNWLWWLMIIAIGLYVGYLILFKWGMADKLGILKNVGQAVVQQVATNSSGTQAVPGGTLSG